MSTGGGFQSLTGTKHTCSELHSLIPDDDYIRMNSIVKEIGRTPQPKYNSNCDAHDLNESFVKSLPIPNLDLVRDAHLRISSQFDKWLEHLRSTNKLIIAGNGSKHLLAHMFVSFLESDKYAYLDINCNYISAKLRPELSFDCRSKYVIVRSADHPACQDLVKTLLASNHKLILFLDTLFYEAQRALWALQNNEFVLIDNCHTFFDFRFELNARHLHANYRQLLGESESVVLMPGTALQGSSFQHNEYISDSDMLSDDSTEEASIHIVLSSDNDDDDDEEEEQELTSPTRDTASSNYPPPTLPPPPPPSSGYQLPTRRRPRRQDDNEKVLAILTDFARTYKHSMPNMIDKLKRRITKSEDGLYILVPTNSELKNFTQAFSEDPSIASRSSATLRIKCSWSKEEFIQKLKDCNI